jgi:hypothetical protein
MTAPDRSPLAEREDKRCGHPIIWAEVWWAVASCYQPAGHAGMHGNDYAGWLCGFMCKHEVIWV